MTDKPNLRFSQIWNMCFGFLGIQFGFALQNANVSRIFQTLGAEIEQIPILWIAAPLTGLLVQPIVGYFSDNTWTRLGRRRPYFVLGSLCATFALFVMPNSSALWVAALVLWLMDASFNIAMEPFRAYVGDMLPDRQRTLGFVTQSFFIGLGAVVASILPWILSEYFSVKNSAEPGEIPLTVRYSFYAGGAVLFVSVMWTVVTGKEYSPEQLARYSAEEKQSHERIDPQFNIGAAIGCGIFAAILAISVYALSWNQELYILAFLLFLYSFLVSLAKQFRERSLTNNALYKIVVDFQSMPHAMKQIAIVQFFSWFALFSMWIYTTSAVTAYHYGTTDTSSALFNVGANWVGVLFGVYNGVAACVAFLIPVLAKKIGRKQTHSLCLFLGGLGLASFIMVTNPELLWVSMIGVGIAWASILSMPYAMLSKSISPEKMGVYMGIFNFFIVIPQLLAASILGLIINFLFSGSAIVALLVGAGCMFIAAAASLTLKSD